jgi:outer membrane protein OmpA-like peptidoglycan-associated protein
MKRLSLAIAVALSSLAQIAIAQNSSTQTNEASQQGASPMVPLTYVGPNARVGVSVNDDGDFAGEALGVFGYNGLRSLLGEAWIGRGGAGGVQLGYNWLWGVKDAQSAIDNPNSMIVAKIFGALDRNSFGDRKATIGAGVEKNDVFFHGYVSKGLTDERFVGTRSTSVTDTISGNEAGRPFTRTRTTTTIFDSFEEGYDRAYGARIGKYIDSNLLRIRGGVDFAKGDFDSDQLTFSAGVDKYFEGTGHSLSLDLASFKRDGQFVTDDSDTGAFLTYRYAFGESFRPAAWEFANANPQPENPSTKAVPEKERVAVETKADLDSDSFFDFDRSTIRPETKVELDRLIGLIKDSKLASKVSVVGHTCSLGSDAYNIGLSNRRANAVADYFKANGIEADILQVAGEGEANPTYPNDTRENRKKNRRVDVSFITVEEKFEERDMPASDGGVTISKQVVSVPPGWIERALKNPADHRREVDTYTFVKTRNVEALGPIVFTNRAPVAVNDAISARRNVPTVIPVLGNDTDADGDTLAVTAVTQGANGSVTFTATGVTYTPRTDFLGTDTFTYTVSDGKGGTATATVTVNVADQAPIAVDDAVSVARGGTVNVMVLTNDTDPEGQALRVTGIDQPANGTASLANNVVTYIAPAGFAGTVSIPYRIVDAAGNTAAARVLVTVTNQAPRAVNDTASTNVAQPVTVSVLTNDSDPENDAIRLDAVGTAANGMTVISGSNVLYTPRAGFTGADTFTYTIKDSFGASATATVTVNVNNNLPPIARDDLAYVAAARNSAINVLVNDADPEGGPLTIVSATGASAAALQIDGNRIIYRHNGGAPGVDQFTYTIRDDAGNTATATVRVTVVGKPGG